MTLDDNMFNKDFLREEGSNFIDAAENFKKWLHRKTKKEIIGFPDLISHHGTTPFHFRKYLPEGTVFIPEILLDPYLKAAKYAKNKTRCIMIHGETGTGKSHLARFIHQNGPFPKEPFEQYNAAHHNDKDKMSALLFGTNARAYTNVKESQEGLISRVGKGTLFIDEIDKLDYSLQGVLLDILDSGAYRKGGETKTRNAECRMLFATNADLAQLTKSGKFLKDLFYRINKFEIQIPPFKLWPKVSFFSELLYHKFEEEYSPMGESSEYDPAEEEQYENRLMYWRERVLETVAKQTGDFCIWDDYDWPGNQREFISYFEEGFALSDWTHVAKTDKQGTQRDDQIYKDFPMNPQQFPTYEELEKAYFSKLYEHAHGNKVHAARLAGIDIGKLKRRLRDYDIK